MGKYLFIGVKEDLDLFFERAQKEGIIEFIPAAKKSFDLPKDLQDLSTAIRILKKEVPHHEKEYGSERDPLELARRVVFLKTQVEALHEEKRALQHEVERVRIFGDFSMEDLKEIEKKGGKLIRFFAKKLGKGLEEKPIPEDMIYIGTDYPFQYFIAIADEKKFYPNFIEVFIHEPLGDVQIRLSLAQENLKNSQRELKDLVGYADFLKQELLSRLNQYHLEMTKAGVGEVLDGEMFVSEAWIPKGELKKVFPLLSKIGVHMEQIAVDEGDKIPTCMQNEHLVKAGEDLVKIYDVPSHEDKDPSLFILIAFAIFFAMIVSDAGYGFVYLVSSIFLYFKVKKGTSKLGLRMTKMAIMISSVCVAWGVLTTSYFGIQISPQNPLQKASLIQYLVKKKALYHIEKKDAVYQEWIEKSPELAQVKDPFQFLLGVSKEPPGSGGYEILEEFIDNVLMEIALLVGIIHIIISLGRYAFRNYSATGWILFIIGGYLFFPSMLDATTFFHFGGWLTKETSRAVGLQLLYIGLGFAFIAGLIQNKLRGLEEPVKAIQIFADILSYLRLYALALAGMIMGVTFNHIGQDIGFVFGFIVIVFGHITNMSLGIMGGIIHGLRLNFLEWYHYSFIGGGKLFKPLKIIK